MRTTIRPLTTTDDTLTCVSMQRRVFGATFASIVPAEIMTVALRIGGALGGAIDADGRLIGFVFAMAGRREGEDILWCEMVAVDPDRRDGGVGRELMIWLAETARSRGVRCIQWSFDPLSTRNARLYLSRLGADVVEFVPGMYDADLHPGHRGPRTDRFIAAWRPDEPKVRAVVATSSHEVDERAVATLAKLGADRDLRRVDSETIGGGRTAVHAVTGWPDPETERVLVSLSGSIDGAADQDLERLIGFQTGLRQWLRVRLEMRPLRVGFLSDPLTRRGHYLFE